jgi:hypothetical protein
METKMNKCQSADAEFPSPQQQKQIPRTQPVAPFFRAIAPLLRAVAPLLRAAEDDEAGNVIWLLRHEPEAGAGLSISAAADDRPLELWPQLQMIRKRKGECGEAFVLWRAFALGFNVGMLWGDAAQFDFILEWGGRLSRIQVKAAFQPSQDRCNRYVFRTTSRGDARVTYTQKDTDFLVCVIPPLGLSYVIPIAEIGKRQKQLYVYPGDARGEKRRVRGGKNYGKFLERWDLLK